MLSCVSSSSRLQEQVSPQEREDAEEEEQHREAEDANNDDEVPFAHEMQQVPIHLLTELRLAVEIEEIDDEQGEERA